jgi:hypothetical protein
MDCYRFQITQTLSVGYVGQKKKTASLKSLIWPSALTILSKAISSNRVFLPQTPELKGIKRDYSTTLLASGALIMDGSRFACDSKNAQSGKKATAKSC